MKTHWWAIVLIIGTTIFNTLAQYFFKIGVELDFILSFPEIFLLWPILAGFVSYAIGAVLMIAGFKGGEVTVLYPIVATSYVWVVFMGAFVFGETLTALKIVGSLVLVLGITMIAKGGKQKSVIAYEEPL